MTKKRRKRRIYAPSTTSIIKHEAIRGAMHLALNQIGVSVPSSDESLRQALQIIADQHKEIERLKEKLKDEEN